MTDTTFKRPSLRQRRRHLVRQLFNGWPWIAWISAAIAVLFLLPGGLYRIRFYGTAERVYEYVSPLEGSRLKSLLVELGDSVQAGQLLGELSNESTEAQLLMDQAALARTTESIRFNAERLKLDEAKLSAEILVLEAQWKRTEELLAKKLIAEQDAEDLRPEIEAMKQVLARYPELITQLETQLKAITQDLALKSVDRLNQLQDRQNKLIATASGVVAEILHQPGDVVVTGDPILRISNTNTTKVIAFMTEEKNINLFEGDSCRVITSTGRRVYRGVVKSITADIRKLPVFTGFGDQILRGRRIVVELNADNTLIPGEQVVVVPDISIFKQWFGRRR
jgi:multidrug resistance efflux pump